VKVNHLIVHCYWITLTTGERKLEQPLQEIDKLNEILSHKDKEVKELQEKVDLLTEQLKMKQKVEAIGDKLSEEHKQLLTVKGILH
jgi:uncharacterized coiled-coil protein SlyX